MNLAATLNLDNRGFTNPLVEAQRMLAAFRGGLGGLLGPLAAIAGSLLGVASALATVKKAVDEAATIEDFEVALTTLLGSADKAKQRIGDLAEFAAKTPFQLPEVVSASQLLQAFTGDALATGAGLRLVGDSAAAVKRPLQDVTMWMGRLYAGLKDGEPLGEPIQNLTQLGLISSTVRKQLAAVQGQALSDARVMEVLTAAFGKNAGAMERLSQTYNGKISTMKDAVDAAFRSFGEPIRDALKPFLDDATARIDGLGPRLKAAGQEVAAALQAVQGAIVSDRVGDLLGAALRYGYAQGLNFFLGGIRAGAVALGAAVGTALGNLGGIKDVLLGAAAQFGAALLKAMREPLAWAQASFENLFDRDNASRLKMATKEAEAELRGNDKRFQGRSGYDLYGANGTGDLEFLSALKQRTDEIAKAQGIKTIESRTQEILSTGGPRFGFGGKPMTSSEIATEGSQIAARGVAALQRPIGDLLEQIKKAFVGIGAEDFAGAGDARRQLGALMAELRAAVAGAQQTADEASRQAGSAAGEAAGGLSGKNNKIEGDRLSRIGVFIGGAGGPALDYARRTAMGIEKIVTIIKTNPIRPAPLAATFA